MREILFRGKPVNKAIYTNFEKKFKNASFFSNGFVFGSLVIYENKYYICLNIKLNMSGIIFNSNESNMTATMIEVIPETVGQFTGLTDKNGKKIFEGDVLRAAYQPEQDVIIEWSDGSFRFRRADKPKDYVYCNIRYIQNAVGRLKIIGNIYDNPELLKGIKNVQL